MTALTFHAHPQLASCSCERLDSLPPTSAWFRRALPSHAIGWGAEDDEWGDLFADPPGPENSRDAARGGAAIRGDAGTMTMAVVEGANEKSPKPTVAPKVTTTSRLSLQVSPTTSQGAPPTQVSVRVKSAAAPAASAGLQSAVKEEDDFFGSVRSLASSRGAKCDACAPTKVSPRPLSPYTCVASTTAPF